MKTNVIVIVKYYKKLHNEYEHCASNPKMHSKNNTICTENVGNVICKAGAGIIGNYTHCSTTTKSTGTFIPNDNANPYIGEANKLEIVSEEKLEVICDIAIVKNVLNKLREVHPYEEPGIDIIPLLDEKSFD